MSHVLPPFVRTAPPPGMGKKGRANWNKRKDRDEAIYKRQCALLDAGVAYDDLDKMMYPREPEWPVSSNDTSTSWSDEPEPKSEAELVAERVQKNLKGWPWVGHGDISPQVWKKLLLVVRLEVQRLCTRLTSGRPRSNIVKRVTMLHSPTTRKTRAALCPSCSAIETWDK